MSTTRELRTLAKNVITRLNDLDLKVTAAESCTGGLISKLLTDIPGSSACFEFGFVTYSNSAKQQLLGVSDGTIGQWGAVSEKTVLEMAAGALQASGAAVSVAVSGIAGPGGATPGKPVGTVWIAWAGCGHPPAATVHVFKGNRDSVRRQSAAIALRGILERMPGA